VIILDSGAVTLFARHPAVLTEYQRKRHPSEMVVVPSAVLIECRTGDPRRDTPVDRLLKRIHIDERISDRLARSASELRTAARRGSVIDALVVAYAALPASAGARVVTGDLGDLRALAAYARGVVIEGI
jgi:hypothetical protein